MSMLGSIGDVSFEVSEQSVRTFNELTQSHSAVYAEHKILGRKGLLEFTGLNASTCSLKIELNASLGLIPVEEIERLYEMLNNHEAVSFMLGNKVQGGNLWVIESMNVNYDTIGGAGEIYRASVNLNLKEYIE